MKQKIVGIYRAGSDQAQVVLREGQGGEFYFVPEKGSVPRLKIGADYESWNDVVAVLLHETFEFLLTRMDCRLIIDNYSNDSEDYLFHFNHGKLSDLCARAAMFLTVCLPDFATAWNQWKKENKTSKK